MGNKKTINIGTRGSRLAMAQTAIAISHLQDYFEVNIVPIKTTGDRIQDRPLYEIGGKALFTKEIEEALLSKQIDIAIHSLKDVEAQYPQSLCFPCVLERDDRRDAFLSKQYNSIDELPIGAIIGSASVRREAQLLLLRPDLQFECIRGNIDTRIQKLKNSYLDGIILAVAGLKRINLSHEIKQIFTPEEIMPAVGQGIIALQCRTNDEELISILKLINDQKTYCEFLIERAFVEEINGSCTTPLAVNVIIQKEMIDAEFMILKRDGSFSVKIRIIDRIENAVEMGKRAGQDLKKYLIE